MKILIDENLPVRIKSFLEKDHEIYTISDKKWNSIENGKLLSLMQQESFDFLITSDKNIPHQQNIKKFGINLIILRTPDIRLETIEKLKGKILNALSSRQNLIQIIS